MSFFPPPNSYWTLHFDTAPRTLRTLNSIMRRDPRVIRWTVLRLGTKVEDIAKEGAKSLKGDLAGVADLIN
jgi:small subunit ribosomal protein S6